MCSLWYFNCNLLCSYTIFPASYIFGIKNEAALKMNLDCAGIFCVTLTHLFQKV